MTEDKCVVVKRLCASAGRVAGETVHCVGLSNQVNSALLRNVDVDVNVGVQKCGDVEPVDNGIQIGSR